MDNNLTYFLTKCWVVQDINHTKVHLKGYQIKFDTFQTPEQLNGPYGDIISSTVKENELSVSVFKPTWTSNP